MPSDPKTSARVVWFGAILARAFVYALAITALVLYAPSAQHVFIYQGF